MKILITGSNGLLGQKLLHKLRLDDRVELVATSKGENRVSVKEGYTYHSLDVTNNLDVSKLILFLTEKMVHIKKKPSQIHFLIMDYLN